MIGYEVYSDLQEISPKLSVHAIFNDNGNEIKIKMTHIAKLRHYEIFDNKKEFLDYVFSYCAISSLGYFESPLDISNFVKFEVIFITEKLNQEVLSKW